jgi:hypothetical protein
MPANPSAVGGVPVDGTSSENQTNLSVLNQPILDWPPGTALWLVWQMSDATGKAQGLAIDNLSFSASTQAPVYEVPIMFSSTSTNLVLSWMGVTGQVYQMEYKDDLRAGSWTALGSPITGTGAMLSFTNDLSQSSQRFYRLQIFRKRPGLQNPVDISRRCLIVCALERELLRRIYAQHKVSRTPDA